MDEEQKPAGAKEKNTGMAALSYLDILVVVPLLTDAKNDPFVKFHVAQGLVLLIVWVVGSFVFWVPFVGWLLGLIALVLSIIGLIAALNGEKKELPIIGNLAKNFKL